MYSIWIDRLPESGPSVTSRFSPTNSSYWRNRDQCMTWLQHGLFGTQILQPLPRSDRQQFQPWRCDDTWKSHQIDVLEKYKHLWWFANRAPRSEAHYVRKHVFCRRVELGKRFGPQNIIMGANSRWHWKIGQKRLLTFLWSRGSLFFKPGAITKTFVSCFLWSS